jgi:hypothetical protein
VYSAKPSQNQGQCDFRTSAVVISQAIIESRHIEPARGDLTSLGVSLCVPAPGSPADFRKSITFAYVFVALMGLGGLLAGVEIVRGNFLLFQAHLSARWTSISLLIGVGSFVGGISILLCAFRLERRVILRHLRKSRAATPSFDPAQPPIVVLIKDSAQFFRLQFITDDVGVAYFDQRRNLAVIEGFSHRYVIVGRDVVAARQLAAASWWGVTLTVRVAGSDEVLSLSLIYGTVGQHVKRQTIGLSRQPLVEMLERGLGITVQ